MFLLVDQFRNVSISPQFLGPQFRVYVENRLREEVEGTMSLEWGQIISVAKVLHTDKARCQDGSGKIIVPTQFTALTFRPYKGEVLDARVESVCEQGFFAYAGALRIFVSETSYGAGWKLDEPGASRCVHDEMGLEIKQGGSVRIRVIGFQADLNGMFAIGSIDAHGAEALRLGPQEDDEEDDPMNGDVDDDN
uniref:RNA polymerase Rpb7-like N-terminal domain-containing protein n=1 Tax=Chromera velia CCMP2878 TaxID=1169474 RepID=A0A0G4G4X8_9ALVE|mmetsp:Transcript_49329/g.97185  ORF Transcript_49329/g.97185 Transcript_49329/m.97185 type:complete len:193 (+) Transcript_49329:178-756(+)|eukprot:Cvel_4163.t1-p1 / transcript=Cvel_4163.t1 / gene=Cvel_4163 / organism=Chromera_velia_CCMP2878 / gene_product=DNA-directed RNA polymerase II subunit RPB7, putative / transcript_product=DNA-directed RNA polymerase II subunit RPB7, putative / location=Cvel_scaffold179:34613-35188(-) / protein_length=192 / sequence_SO=supercontig / SO=protein_coding / is_pseudo=false